MPGRSVEVPLLSFDFPPRATSAVSACAAAATALPAAPDQVRPVLDQASFGVSGRSETVSELPAERRRFGGKAAFEPRAAGGHRAVHHYAGQPVLNRENVYDLAMSNCDTRLATVRTATARTAGSARSGRPRELEVLFAEGAPLAVSRWPVHETRVPTTIHQSRGSQHAHTMTVLPAGGARRSVKGKLADTTVTQTRVGAGIEGLPGVGARAMWWPGRKPRRPRSGVRYSGVRDWVRVVGGAPCP